MEMIVLYFLSRRVVKGVYRFFYRVTKRKNWTVYLFAMVFLPGTFIHEISHFLAALFLLVPVGKFELLPKIEEEGSFKLGSVSIAKTDPLRRFLIGVAPLVFGLSVILGLLYYVLMIRIISTWWEYLLLGFIIFQVANSMFASKKDLEGALVLFIFIVFVIVLLLILGVRIPIDWVSLSFNKKIEDFLINANLFLLIPIVIDSVFITVSRKLRPSGRG